MSRRCAFMILAATTATACSFLAFDDYTSEPGSDPDAAANADSPSSTSDAIAPGSDARGGGDAPTSDSATSDPYGDVVRVDAPVAWYRFEENVGATAAQDSAGNRSANQIAGTMGFGGAGISGRGLVVPNGAGGFTLGNALGFAGPTPFSLEVWVKPDVRIDGHFLFDKREVVDASFAGWLLYLKEDHTAYFEDWGTKLYANVVTPIPSGWVHLVAVVAVDGSSGTARLYVNGMAGPTNVIDPTFATPATAVDLKLLAKYAGGADELAIYDKALTPARISAHYLAGKP